MVRLKIDKLLFQRKAHYHGNCTGIFSGDALATIEKSPISEVIITDSIKQSTAVKNSPVVKILSVANLLGEAIRRIHNGESVSSLFRYE